MDDGALLGGEGWKVVRRRDAPGGRAGEAEERGGGWTEKGGCRCSTGWRPAVVLDVTLAVADGPGDVHCAGVDWRAVGG